MKERRPLAAMRARAEALAADLAPYCARIEIAGSIRRGKPTVADIELVAAPRFTPSPDDLFGTPRNALDAYARERLAAGAWHHRLDKNGHPACGERFKRLTIEGDAVDLFVVLPPAQWGLALLVRTGSADFSAKCMTAKSRGGFMPDGCGVHDFGIYCGGTRDGSGYQGGTLIETPEESDVFKVLGVPWIEPAVREVA